MNILLQNKKTLHYVEQRGGWTGSPENARVFGTGLEAMLFCHDHRFGNMQILAEFADVRMNFTFPLTDPDGE